MNHRKINSIIFLSFFFLAILIYKISSPYQVTPTTTNTSSQKSLLEKQAASYTHSYQIKKAIQAILEYKKLS